MEKPPQFLKMNPVREENPPPRHLACPEYKKCLTLAAYGNYCLDCGACEAADAGEIPSAQSLARRAS